MTCNDINAFYSDARLASPNLSGVEDELKRFDEKVVVEQNGLLDKTTNALLDIGKL